MTLNFTQQQQQRIPGSTDFPFHLSLLLLPARKEFYCAIELLLQIFNFILFPCMHAAHFLFSCKLTIIWSIEKKHERSEKAVKKRREMERIQLVLKVRQTSSFKLSEIYTHTCKFKREVFNSFEQKL